MCAIIRRVNNRAIRDAFAGPTHVSDVAENCGGCVQDRIGLELRFAGTTYTVRVCTLCSLTRTGAVVGDSLRMGAERADAGAGRHPKPNFRFDCKIRGGRRYRQRRGRNAGLDGTGADTTNGQFRS
jgi:hypothetical protein